MSKIREIREAIDTKMDQWEANANSDRGPTETIQRASHRRTRGSEETTERDPGRVQIRDREDQRACR